ncbi:MAG: hypothetical protein AAB195_02125 [candidate division NC10 bacterium]
MIIVDNAVEYMCKAYVEVHASLIPNVVKKQKWEDIKGSFAQTLNFVASQEPRLKSHVGTIIGFHEVRNKLYHGGQPLSVKASTVDDYSKRARTVLETLLGVKEDEETQAKRTTSIHTALLGEAKKEVKAGVTFESLNDAVRFSAAVDVKLPDAICLVLHGFAREKGKSPTVEQLQESLSYSGHTPTKKIISVRLSELRKKGVVRKGGLTLTAPGRTKLLTKYLP